LRRVLDRYTRKELEDLRVLFLHEYNHRHRTVGGIEEDFQLQMRKEVLRQIDVVLATKTF